MNEMIRRQQQVIDNSGLGLLPGIALAFGLCLMVMTALLVNAWWATFSVLAVLFLVTAAIVWVVVQMTGDDTAE